MTLNYLKRLEHEIGDRSLSSEREVDQNLSVSDSDGQQSGSFEKTLTEKSGVRLHKPLEREEEELEEVVTRVEFSLQLL